MGATASAGAPFTMRDLREAIATPPDGIVSRTIFADADVRVVLFSFAAGQGLTDHTAAVPVLIQVVDGEARIGISDDVIEGRPGTWLHVPAHTSHSIEALSALTLLLVLLTRHGTAGHGRDEDAGATR
jgi:quercetin dioxygenase-like cupin family protein